MNTHQKGWILRRLALLTLLVGLFFGSLAVVLAGGGGLATPPYYIRWKSPITYTCTHSEYRCLRVARRSQSHFTEVHCGSCPSILVLYMSQKQNFVRNPVLTKKRLRRDAALGTKRAQLQVNLPDLDCSTKRLIVEKSLIIHLAVAQCVEYPGRDSNSIEGRKKRLRMISEVPFSLATGEVGFEHTK